MATKSKKGASDVSSTQELNVPERIIDQVIGQDNSVELIRKAALQRRNVLLIGEPGTGKSMLAQAMAEILPLEQLEDILVYPNFADSNNPKIRTVPAGKGKRVLNEMRINAQKEKATMRLVSWILPLLWFLFAFVLWRLGWIDPNPVAAATVFAAMMIVGVFMIIGLTLGTQMRARDRDPTPKLLIDNAAKKIAPFTDATGAHSGALLGDVKHDPLQSSINEVEFVVCRDGIEETVSFEQLWREMAKNYPHKILKYENDYEAIVFPLQEEVYVYGLNEDNEIVKSRIYSMNRRPYEGEVVEISSSSAKVTLTPEHEVYTARGDKDAEKLSKGDELIKFVKQEVAKIFS